MKLRILDHSIRFRLRRSEVHLLLEDGLLTRVTRFGITQRLVYELAIDDRTADVVASCSDGTIRVSIPMDMARLWATSDAVGIEANQSTGGIDLRILIEKDFNCAHHEDDAPLDKFTPATLVIT